MILRPMSDEGNERSEQDDDAEERLLEEGYREMPDELELAHMSLPATFEALPPE